VREVCRLKGPKAEGLRCKESMRKGMLWRKKTLNNQYSMLTSREENYLGKLDAIFN